MDPNEEQPLLSGSRSQHQYTRDATSTPVHISVQGLSYAVGDVDILRGISCYFEPGKLIVIMGPTGSGKTSLLNVLAGRGRGTVMGDILVNGKKVTDVMLRTAFKMVPEEDVLFSALTPRETLQYSAELRLPESMSAGERSQRVERVLSDLKLTGCADTVIGSTGQRTQTLSLSERKRTNIGLEMLTVPRVLFIHEPTGGLDPVNVYENFTLLRNIAHQSNRTIVCSASMLSYASFCLFDQVLLLSNGEIAYYGPGEPDCLRYFASLGYHCPHDVSPTDWILATLEEGDPDTSFPQLWHQSHLAKTKPTIEKSNIPLVEDPLAVSALEEGGMAALLGDGRYYTTSALTQFNVLLRRTVYIYIRDREQFFSRMRTHVLIAILLGLAYMNLSERQDDWQDRCSVLFIASFFSVTNALMTTVSSFPADAVICYIENFNGTYRLLPFYASRVICVLAFQGIYAITFSLLLYFMVDLHSSFSSFATFVACSFLLGSIGAMLGLCVGFALPTLKFIQTVLPPILFPLQVFSGYLVRPDNIPKYFYWIYKISFYQFGYQVLCTNEFEDLTFDDCTCDEDDRAPEGGCTDCPFGEGVQTGDAVLDDVLDFENDHEERRFIQLFIYLLLMIMCGYLVMKQKALSY